MAGVTVGQLIDLYNKSGLTAMSGPQEVLNESEYRSWMLSWALSGDVQVQGSPRLVDWILFDAGNTAQFYNPGSTRSYSNPQFDAQIESAWRFLEDYTYNLDVEQELNEHLSADAAFDQFKSVMKFKQVAAATRINKKMEDTLLAQPDVTKHEVLASSTSGSPVAEPYPIFATVNEFAGPSTAGTLNNGTGLPNGFTTIQNQNPTTQTGWRCNQVGYGNDAIATSTVNSSAASLLSSMSLAIKACGYDEMPYRPDAGTASSALTSEYCWFGSIAGVNYFEKVLRASQDHFHQIPTDPKFGSMNMPYFQGIPVKYIQKWSEAAVFPTSGQTAPAVGSGAVELSADNAGPRFALLGRRWFMPIFHKKGNFVMRPEIRPSTTPDAHIMLMKIWYQNWCRSRQRQAMVYPIADITL